MEKQDEKEVELFSSIIEDEVKQVCSLLKDNKILFVRRDYGSGSYMNLYYGQSFQEKKIFVNEKDYHKALEIISSVYNCETLEDSHDEMKKEENNEEIKEENDDEEYYKIKDLFRAYILGMIFIPLIVALIVCIMQIF